MYIPRHQKTYLSRAMTRAMALDHPIGDPYGGPAYGQRNDPVSAIISLGTMFATGGAVMAGTATLMQGLMFAGAAVSLVGNVTGNRTLSRIGMITGLAGGVGALAESAGLFASGTMGETFGYGANAAGAAGAAPGVAPVGEALAQTPTAVPDAPMPVQNMGPNAALIGPDALAGGPGPLGAPPVDIAASSAGVSLSGTPTATVPGVDLGTGSVAPGSQAGLINSATAPAAAPAAAAPGAAAPGAPTAAAPGAPTVPGGFETIPNTALPGQPGYGWQYFTDGASGAAISPSGQYFLNGTQVTGAGGGAMGFSDYAGQAMQGLKNAGGGLMDLAKSNPGAALMLGQAAGSVGDVLSGKTSAQIDALEAQGQLTRAQADRIRYEIEVAKQRRANLNNNYANVPNPLATWTPNFQVVPPGQQPGLIGGAMTPPRG